jgi:hypothetical protein
MKKIINVLLIATILTSCVRSLYPLAENEKEMIFKKELLGNWKDKDGVAYLIDTLKGHDGKVYRIIEINDRNNNFGSGDTSYLADTSYFKGMLVNIKGNYFMDCTAAWEQMQAKKLGVSAANSLLPTHLFIKVSNIQQNSIELSAMDPDKLSMLLKQKKINIRHEVIKNEEILLTEKSKTLQQKLMELEKFPFVYGETNRLIRIR